MHDEVNSTLMTQNNKYINSHNNLQIFSSHKRLHQAQSLNTKPMRTDPLSFVLGRKFANYYECLYIYLYVHVHM